MSYSCIKVFIERYSITVCELSVSRTKRAENDPENWFSYRRARLVCVSLTRIVAVVVEDARVGFAPYSSTRTRTTTTTRRRTNATNFLLYLPGRISSRAHTLFSRLVQCSLRSYAAVETADRKQR